MNTTFHYTDCILLHVDRFKQFIAVFHGLSLKCVGMSVKNLWTEAFGKLQKMPRKHLNVVQMIFGNLQEVVRNL